MTTTTTDPNAVTIFGTDLESVFIKQIGNISRGTGYGNLSTAFTNLFKGINYRGPGNPVPINTDQHGFVFFTRPCLNLSYDNISSNRMFTSMLTDNPLSLQRIVRAYLDPRANQFQNITTPLVDPLNAFIPLLSNSLISMGGWPDVNVQTYTTKSGMLNEEFSMIDGTARILNTWDSTLNLRNVKGDPITFLFLVWVFYATMVYIGRFNPYMDMIIDNEIDYNTRVYRIVLDKSKQFVTKVASTIAFPTVVPLGASFNFTDDHPLIRDIDQVSIQFRCMGAEYYDPIIIQEFNAVVSMFNPHMVDGLRQSVYQKLTLAERMFFNYSGYPYIDPNTFEFEIWVDKSMYQAWMSGSLHMDPVIVNSPNMPNIANGIWNSSNGSSNPMSALTNAIPGLSSLTSKASNINKLLNR